MALQMANRSCATSLNSHTLKYLAHKEEMQGKQELTKIKRVFGVNKRYCGAK